MENKLKAVIWDFDGTLVDTEPIWVRSEQAILAEHGVTWDDERMSQMIGQSAVLSAQQIAEAIGRPSDWRRVFDDVHQRLVDHLRSHDLPYLPGVEPLVEELERTGTRAAIVTASNAFIMSAVRERLPEVFEVIVCADDVTRSKPDPEAYLQAFDRLGVDPCEAIVLEDSVPGTRSALDAGALVFAVPEFVRLEPHPRMQVSDDGLRTTDLVRLTEVWRELKEAACVTPV